MILAASPGLTDPNFARSLVYLVSAGPDGALGFVVNRPLGLPLEKLPLARDLPDPLPQMTAHFGGPVRVEGLSFALFQAGATEQEVSCELVEEPARLLPSFGRPGHWPKAFMGYAGWGEGQLEAELARDDWKLCPPSPALFELPSPGAMWEAFVGPDQRWRSFWRRLPAHPERN